MAWHNHLSSVDDQSETSFSMETETSQEHYKKSLEHRRNRAKGGDYFRSRAPLTEWGNNRNARS